MCNTTFNIGFPEMRETLEIFSEGGSKTCALQNRTESRIFILQLAILYTNEGCQIVQSFIHTLHNIVSWLVFSYEQRIKTGDR